MNRGKVIAQTEKYIHSLFKNEASGHDWWHIYRVWNMVKRIAKQEHANSFIVEMAALLHDLGDYKLESDRKDRQKEKVEACLQKVEVSWEDGNNILDIISQMSFSKNFQQHQKLSLEGRVVQDADRLDALGAMGIMRTFLYAGAHGIVGYDPSVKVRKHTSVKSYKTHEASALNHFYEKLLLLKKSMNTKTGKKLAE